MSLFGRSFGGDCDDDPIFGFSINKMSRHKKNSLSYTIPADDGYDDDDDDDSGNNFVDCDHGSHSRSRRRTDKNRFPSITGIMSDYNNMVNCMFGRHNNMFGMGMGQRERQNHLMPFGFPNMVNIFDGFQFDQMQPNSHSYSSSTFVTMSRGPDGRPHVYKASETMTVGPGGIRETKKSVCDSRTGTKKMAIGHHIGDRAHVLEREQNMHSGEQEERQEFINLDEDEAEEFNREWESKAFGAMNALGYRGNSSNHSRQSREDLPAIQGRYRPRARITPRRHNYPAITSSHGSEQTSERPKKRYHDEQIISSDEEEGKEEEVVVKKSQKREVKQNKKGKKQ